MSLRKLIIISAFAIAAAGLSSNASAQFRQNIDMPGRDYRSFDINSASGCLKICLGDPRCRAWTWMKPGFRGPNAHCWLKNGEPRSVENRCCISGVRGAVSID